MLENSLNEEKNVKVNISNTKWDYGVSIGAEYRYFITDETALKVENRALINFSKSRFVIQNSLRLGLIFNL